MRIAPREAAIADAAVFATTLTALWVQDAPSWAMVLATYVWTRRSRLEDAAVEQPPADPRVPEWADPTVPPSRRGTQPPRGGHPRPPRSG